MTEATNSAGATPAAAGATPAQTPPAQPATPTPAAAPTPPATGDPDALGDAGKAALEKERSARKAAEAAAREAVAELEKIRTANQSEADKALADAKKAGGDEVLARVHTQVRRSEVKAALSAAGINGQVLELATKDDRFTSLKVKDDGVVDGLEDAVKAFKAAQPDLFKAPATPGTADGGARGGKTVTRDQLKTMTPDQINKAFDEGALEGLLKPGG